MSWNLLERFIESDHFNNDPSLSVAYLSRYADHVGIHYVLCSKLRQFAYEEIEFFLPQLCHLLISVDNESMALEEFIVDLCEESVNGALLTFWLFQTYLHDLSGNPQSHSFKTCRRIYNKVQRIVFGSAESIRKERIKENVLPVTVLSSIILAGIAAPWLPRHAGPLAVAQARRPRPTEEVVIGLDVGQTQKLGRSHTVSGGTPRPRKPKAPQGQSDTDENRPRRAQKALEGQLDGEEAKLPKRSKTSQGRVDLVELPHRPRRIPTAESQEIPKDRFKKSPRPGSRGGPSGTHNKPSMLIVQAHDARLSSSSLPDVRAAPEAEFQTPPATAGLVPKAADRLHRRHSHATRPLSPGDVPREQKIRMLRSNYFRSETQFLTALEDISNRLVIVPKPARLSALRAELALIAQDLPAEVDIPVICPAVLEDGAAGKSRHHRIVRLNPAEATSLNSAERVPYLLMVEVLLEDFDFDPDSEANQQLLGRLMQEKGVNKRRLFDLTEAARDAAPYKPVDGAADSVFEPSNGDLGSTALIKDPAEDDITSTRPRTPSGGIGVATKTYPRSSSGANTTSSRAISTPRTSDMDSRSGSPAPRRMTLGTGAKAQGTDQPDFSALATHMRTAAQMLAQLDSSSSKRPKVEVAAIKAKIIASMQSLEEQNFYMDDGVNPPTFDTIMAKADAGDAVDPEFDETLELPSDSGSNSGAGAARMENDQKTGGVQRKGDRDDPSAATFGEEWTAKKERIRRSSPYGWMKNWDLVSVIVKTGADLRQEAFACQLIRVCSKIWQEAEVPVWVKRMRILVTGDSSGLIETITNGVSLHSLKRSLTLASISAGTNPRKRIATLRDHFVKTFGEVESDGYNAGVAAFSESLAAYSIICYVLQLKDRHNGNILIDNVGHIIHIDFGFMLSNSPGSMGFEAAPFKLTQEYIDVLGGIGSPAFEEFKRLCREAFLALRKEAERIIMLVEMMGRQSKMPCYSTGVVPAVNALRARFVLQLSGEQAGGFVDELVAKSAGSYYTRLYDTFQYRTQGIY